MQKRKIIFSGVLIVCIAAVTAAFCLKTAAGIAALFGAAVLLYLAYKPLIPTPAPIWYLYHNRIKPRLCKNKVPAPSCVPGGYQRPVFGEFDADFYISPAGDDSNDGSASAPFATFSRAQQAVRTLDKAGRSAVVVAVCAGEYALSGVVFGKEDGGSETCPVIYKAHGAPAILSGGISLTPADFEKVSDPHFLHRLPKNARNHVLAADLTKLGLTPQQIGKIHTVGTYPTAENYDGDWVGAQFCELFIGGKRQTIARWPNSDFARTGKIIRSCGGSESEQTGTFAPNWSKNRNPQSDIFRVDPQTAAHISRWESFEDVWMFGYWMYDWADASTPIDQFDAQKRELYPKFVSKWGVRKNAPYYFFNIPEELDAPGEWYLDRRSMTLYLYPPHDFEHARISLSVTKNSILDIRAEHIVFDGFTIRETRGDGVFAQSDHVTLRNCTVANVAGNAIVMHGSHNRVENTHICHIGKAGILLHGGDRENLIPGNCVAENCLIHNWSEIYRTYCPAVQLDGIGNLCRSNEMYDSPHEVIWYHGNDHVIENNHIHHACHLTKDGGAIYAGKDWSYYGCVVRGNVIHDLGSPYYTASAIYMDDAISGQTICDNRMFNIPGIAIQLGGGRDLTVKNNTIVNCTNTPISYDNRAREGALFGGWFHYCSEKGGLMWKRLNESAWKSELWQKHYPQMAAFVEDFDRCDDPCFVPNPGCSEITDNVIYDPGPFRGNIICKEAKKFGKVANNCFCPLHKYGKENNHEAGSV